MLYITRRNYSIRVNGVTEGRIHVHVHLIQTKSISIYISMANVYWVCLAFICESVRLFDIAKHVRIFCHFMFSLKQHRVSGILIRFIWAVTYTHKLLDWCNFTLFLTASHFDNYVIILMLLQYLVCCDSMLKKPYQSTINTTNS